MVAEWSDGLPSEMGGRRWCQVLRSNSFFFLICFLWSGSSYLFSFFAISNGFLGKDGDLTNVDQVYCERGLVFGHNDVLIWVFFFFFWAVRV